MFFQNLVDTLLSSLIPLLIQFVLGLLTGSTTA